MNIKKASTIILFIIILVTLSANVTRARAVSEVSGMHSITSSSPQEWPEPTLESYIPGPPEPPPDFEIDFDNFNETPHKGHILNGIPYEYIGHTEQRISEIFTALIGTDFDDSNLETKRRFVDTPQIAAQIVAVMTAYRQGEGRYAQFFYAISLDEANNCWVVEHRYYLYLRPDGGNTSYFLINRNDAKTIRIEYMGAYFRDDKPEIEPIEDISPDYIFGLSDWAFDKINSLNARGVIPHSMNSYHQEPTIRGEIISLVVNVYESVMGEILTYSSPFKDAGDMYAYKIAIEKGYTVGLIKGVSEDRFDTRGRLTREQAAKILCDLVAKIEGIDTKPNGSPLYKDSESISGWALDYVAYAQENKIMIGDSMGRFNPQDNLTIEEALVAVERLIVQFGW